jgi:hypothetical protein
VPGVERGHAVGAALEPHIHDRGPRQGHDRGVGDDGVDGDGDSGDDGDRDGPDVDGDRRRGHGIGLRAEEDEADAGGDDGGCDRCCPQGSRGWRWGDQGDARVQRLEHALGIGSRPVEHRGDARGGLDALVVERLVHGGAHVEGEVIGARAGGLSDAGQAGDGVVEGRIDAHGLSESKEHGVTGAAGGGEPRSLAHEGL